MASTTRRSYSKFNGLLIKHNRGKSWYWIKGDEERYKVQRRIVNGEKEYRIYFGEWFPVTETVANVEQGETMHYRFAAKGSTYYFDM